MVCSPQRGSDSSGPSTPANSIRGGKTGRKERVYLLFVALVPSVTGSHFSALSTVIAAREKLKPSLPCPAGGEEEAGKPVSFTRLTAVTMYAGYHTRKITLAPNLLLMLSVGLDPAVVFFR